MGALTVFHKLSIFANRTPSKYSQIEKKSLLMVILAKLLFTGFTEELATVLCLVHALTWDTLLRLCFSQKPRDRRFRCLAPSLS